MQMPPAQPSKLGRLSSKEIAEQKFTHLDVAAAYKVHKVRLDRALIKFGHNHPTADGEFADMDQELVLVRGHKTRRTVPDQFFLLEYTSHYARGIAAALQYLDGRGIIITSFLVNLYLKRNIIFV